MPPDPNLNNDSAGRNINVEMLKNQEISKEFNKKRMWRKMRVNVLG